MIVGKKLCLGIPPPHKGDWGMATEKKGERPPRDLSVPETMKIAALLAELMPPGTIGQPVPLATKSSEPPDDHAAGAYTAPALQIDDLDEFEAEAVSPSVVPVGASPLESNLAAVPPLLPDAPPTRSKSSPVVQTFEPAPSQPELVTAVANDFQPSAEDAPTSPRLPPTPVPPPIDESLRTDPGDVAAGQFLAGLNWANDPTQPPIAPPETPAPGEPEVQATADEPSTTTKPHDLELVPLGNLSASGFFSLVNWTNDPQRVRHPRRADYGLDEQTLSQARKNPFYVIGQPRRPERDSVSEVLAEISWD